LDFHRRIHGGTGVTIQGARGTKEGKDSITHRVNHGAFMAFNQGAYMEDDCIKNAPSLLNVPLVKQSHRTIDIRKKSCDKLMFFQLIKKGLIPVLAQERSTMLTNDLTQ
jgi:hypothetical protein